MRIGIKAGQLNDLGLDDQQAAHLVEQINTVLSSCDLAEQAWSTLTQKVLSSQPFNIHSFLYSLTDPDWHDHPETAPAWLPDKHIRDNANITKFMNQHGFHDVKNFHHWTVTHYEDFWSGTVDCLNIIFKKKPESLICDLSQGLESPRWLPGAELNITDSCFTASPDHTAIIYQDSEKQLHKMSYGELNKLSSRIANSLIVRRPRAALPVQASAHSRSPRSTTQFARQASPQAPARAAAAAECPQPRSRPHRPTPQPTAPARRSGHQSESPPTPTHHHRQLRPPAPGQPHPHPRRRRPPPLSATSPVAYLRIDCHVSQFPSSPAAQHRGHSVPWPA